MKCQSKKRFVDKALRGITSILAPAAMLLSSGCSREPSLNVLGSFFPAWILCGVIGIVVAVAVRLVFVRLKFEEQLLAPVLVYPCLAACFTFTVWLMFFS